MRERREGAATLWRAAVQAHTLPLRGKGRRRNAPLNRLIHKLPCRTEVDSE